MGASANEGRRECCTRQEGHFWGKETLIALTRVVTSLGANGIFWLGFSGRFFSSEKGEVHYWGELADPISEVTAFALSEIIAGACCRSWDEGRSYSCCDWKRFLSRNLSQGALYAFSNEFFGINVGLNVASGTVALLGRFSVSKFKGFFKAARDLVGF